MGKAWGVGVGGAPGPGVSRLGVGAISHKFGPRWLAGTDLGSCTHLRIQSAVRLLPTSVRSAPILPPPLPRLWHFRQPCGPVEGGADAALTERAMTLDAIQRVSMFAVFDGCCFIGGCRSGYPILVD